MPDHKWSEINAMLRVNLGSFLFFTILAIIMAGIKDQKDPRDKVHHGGWMAKIFCWVIIVFLMFGLECSEQQGEVGLSEASGDADDASGE
jgi:Na+/proline symporter